MAAHTSDDNNESMKFVADVLNAGFGSRDAALAELSFGLPLPGVFGTETCKICTRDARELPGLKSVEDWNDGSPYRGQKLNVTMLVKVLRASSSSTCTNLSVNAKQVANECMTTPVRFVLELFA